MTIINNAVFQILGTSKAYSNFKHLSTCDFVEKTMKGMKAEMAQATMKEYQRNVALLVCTIIVRH